MTHGLAFVPVGHAGGAPRTTVDVFSSIYTVFLALGTLVGVVVIGYTLYNVVKYRGRDDSGGVDDVARPSLGERPHGSGGGRKLFLSFGISAIIVLSLIVWTYSALLYVEDGPDADDEIEIDVIGQRFSWTFVYPNGHTASDLRVPEDRTIRLNVTSADVFHNIGIPAFRTKTDAIPGQTTTAWFRPEDTGTYEAACFELCGSGHSVMTADVIVMEPGEYRDWYESTGGGEQS